MKLWNLNQILKNGITIVRWLVTGLFVIHGSASVAQEFAITTVEINAEQVVLHYNLLDTTKNRTYTVYVYSSRDNFMAPLTKVTGDVGLEVRPGNNRRIAWSSKEELGANFNGDVEVEVRGRVYVPFIRFEGFQDVDVRKRASPFTVKWSGGTRQNILNIQLYKQSQDGDKLVHTYPNIPNSYEYKLTIPNSVKPGKDYYFRISDTKNNDQVVKTTTFDVKRKIPLVWKAVAVAGVGYLLYELFGPEPPPPGELSPAPDPPGN